MSVKRTIAAVRLAKWLRRYYWHYRQSEVRPDGFTGLADLSRYLKINEATLNRYFHGERAPGLDLLIALHQQFGASYAALLEEDPAAPDNPDQDHPPGQESLIKG